MRLKMRERKSSSAASDGRMRAVIGCRDEVSSRDLLRNTPIWGWRVTFPGKRWLGWIGRLVRARSSMIGLSARSGSGAGTNRASQRSKLPCKPAREPSHQLHVHLKEESRNCFQM